MSVDDNEQMPAKVRTITLSSDLWEKISTYQHGNKIPNEISAIRKMLAEAYEAWDAKKALRP